MQPILRTERLVLRPARAGDLDALHALWTDPDVRRFLFDDRHATRAEAEGILADALALAPRGLGLWILEEGEVQAGCAGLFPLTEHVTAFAPGLAGLVEPLVALAPGCHRRGLAVEALHALVAHAFGTLDLPRLAGVHDAPNTASERMLARAGFRPYRDGPGPAHTLRVHLLERVP